LEQDGHNGLVKVGADGERLEAFIGALKRLQIFLLHPLLASLVSLGYRLKGTLLWKEVVTHWKI